jgi:class 3 adenylate cyclase
MDAPQVQYVRSGDGTAIAYTDMGDGTPLIFSSNIWTHLTEQWRDETRAASLQLVSDGFRLIRYDMRGMGMSDRDVEDFSLEAQTGDLDALREHLALDRFALWGNVHSTPACIAFAAARPERVTHLVLSVPFACGEDWYQALPTLRGLESFREMGDEQWRLYTLAHATTLSTVSGSDPHELAELMRVSTSPATLRRYFAELRKQDVTPLLGQLTVPVLVIQSSGGMGGEFARPVAAAIPGARLAVLPVDAVLPAAGADSGAPPPRAARLTTEFVLGRPSLAAQPADSPARAQRPAPAGSRTILFTDIEANTELLQRLGDDAWRALLREHERTIREQLTAHGGDEVKHTGDGFMASFGSATQALECATALQRAFGERNAQAEHLLRVRIGVNAGEPIAEDRDLFGTAVTMAARIMGEAKGGEVLVSDVVRQLVAGKGFVFADRGEFVPKGFDDAVRLYDVRWREDA